MRFIGCLLTPALGFLYALILFAKLSSFGAIALWSWWWILSPIWIPMMLYVIVLIYIEYSDLRRYHLRLYRLNRKHKQLNKK